MRANTPVALLIAVLGLSLYGHAEDDASTVRKAVERSTLNQAGTKPFHLKAELAPSRYSDREFDRTGEVEIWWSSPTQFKREVRSPEFHQVLISNAGQEWQKNEGDYFPEWLREIAVALIEPVPALDSALKEADEADVKTLNGITHFQWTQMSSDGNVQKGIGRGIAITEKTGLLLYGNGFGWGGMFQDYKNFHGRMVAQTVSAGSPEITAKITNLDDLPELSGSFFDPQGIGGDASLIRTAVIEESALRSNLLPAEPILWPALQDGPLEGALTAEVVVDRTGKVREIGPVVSDNPGINDAARKTIEAMRFSPYLQNGVAVQVVSRVTMPFKTVRPAGVETFESARAYVERGSKVSFPAAGNGSAYVLSATFQVKAASGKIEDGVYVDTWNDDENWRREATIAKSKYVRSRHGEKWYELSDGPDAPLLRLVLKAMEPIPATATFHESDWKIRRDTVNGVSTVRVLTGYESPDGTLDPEHARGYWFDGDGKLIKTYFSGIETIRSDFADFRGLEVAHRIEVTGNGALGMLIRVTEVASAAAAPENTFDLPGDEWNRTFRDEVR